MKGKDTPARRRVVVALHDVAPPFEAEIRAQIESLELVGVGRVALNVVPNWHGRHPLEASPGFVDFLHTRVLLGDELILHGCEHRRLRDLRGTPAGRLRARLFAGSAAEFVSLSPSQADMRVRRGLESCERVGLPHPIAFCAPGWLIAPELLPILRHAGIDHLVGMFSIRNLRASTALELPSLGYMGAPGAQEVGIGLLNRIVSAGIMPRCRAVQVYLHPQGYDRAAFGVGRHPAAMFEILERVGRLVQDEGWVPSTYAEVLRDG